MTLSLCTLQWCGAACITVRSMPCRWSRKHSCLGIGLAPSSAQPAINHTAAHKLLTPQHNTKQAKLTARIYRSWTLYRHTSWTLTGCPDSASFDSSKLRSSFKNSWPSCRAKLDGEQYAHLLITVTCLLSGSADTCWIVWSRFRACANALGSALYLVPA